MNTNNLQTCLRQCFLFEDLAEDEIATLSRMARLRAVPQREVLFSQGDPCEGFYIVATGYVKLFRLSPSGKEQVIAIIGAGETFAEVVLFSGHDYPVCAEAGDNCSVIFLPKKPFLEFLDATPGVSRKLLTALCHRLRQIVALVDSLTLRDAGSRLADYLLSTAESQQADSDDEEGCITLPITKGILASHLNMTPETLSRLFAQMEARGILAVDGSQVILSDPEALRYIADEGRFPSI